MYLWPSWKAHTNMSLSAGRLSYDVNPQRKELSVSVSDMLEDHNYHLRLCRKDFICSGTGVNTLVSPSQYDCVENTENQQTAMHNYTFLPSSSMTAIVEVLQLTWIKSENSKALWVLGSSSPRRPYISCQLVSITCWMLRVLPLMW